MGKPPPPPPPPSDVLRRQVSVGGSGEEGEKEGSQKSLGKCEWKTQEEGQSQQGKEIGEV